MSRQVEVPYIGGVLSKNDYKIPGTRYTRPVVKKWMKELAKKVNGIDGLRVPFEVGVKGYFWDERRPDIHNLFVVIADAVEMGTGINDKHFEMRDDGYEVGHKNQKLIITIG